MPQVAKLVSIWLMGSTAADMVTAEMQASMRTDIASLYYLTRHGGYSQVQSGMRSRHGPLYKTTSRVHAQPTLSIKHDCNLTCVLWTNLMMRTVKSHVLAA